MTTKIVRRGISGRGINQSQFIICTGQAPDIGGAPGVGLSRLRQPVDRSITEVPGPLQFSCDRVETPDHTGRLFCFLVVGDPAT